MKTYRLGASVLGEGTPGGAAAAAAGGFIPKAPVAPPAQTTVPASASLAEIEKKIDEVMRRNGLAQNAPKKEAPKKENWLTREAFWGMKRWHVGVAGTGVVAVLGGIASMIFRRRKG